MQQFILLMWPWVGLNTVKTAVGQIKALVAGATSLPVTLVHRAVAPGHKRKGSEQSSRHAPHQHCSQRLKQELRVTG